MLRLRLATLLCASLLLAPSASVSAVSGAAHAVGASRMVDQATSGAPTDEVGWKVGGTVSGLTGSGLVLSDLGEDLPIDHDGPFEFAQPLPDGAIYKVEVVTQPASPDQTCAVEHGSGTIEGADIDDVTVTCAEAGANPYLDASFGTGGIVTTDLAAGHGEGVAVDDDGALVLVGYGSLDGVPAFAVARYGADGAPDAAFGNDGLAQAHLTQSGGSDEAYDVAIAPDHTIVVVGVANKGAGDDFGIARFDANGSLDGSFGNGGVVTTDFFGGVDRARSVALDGDAIIVAGFAQNGSDIDFAVAKYGSDGSLDTSFGTGGLVTTNIAGQADMAQAVALSPAGDAIVVAGSVARDGGSSPDVGLVRYMAADGSLDQAFGQGGIVRTDLGGDDVANGVVVLADGSVIAGGSALGSTGPDFALAKYGADGQLDPTFGEGGMATTDFAGGTDVGQAVAVTGSGSIVLVGYTEGAVSGMALARYGADGALDPSFGDGGLVTVDVHGNGTEGQDVTIVPADGSVVAGGTTQNGSQPELLLVRLHP